MNRARFLSQERDANRQVALREQFHEFTLTTYQRRRAKKAEEKMRSVQKNHRRGDLKIDFFKRNIYIFIHRVALLSQLEASSNQSIKSDANFIVEISPSDNV